MLKISYRKESNKTEIDFHCNIEGVVSVLLRSTAMTVVFEAIKQFLNI